MYPAIQGRLVRRGRSGQQDRKAQIRRCLDQRDQQVPQDRLALKGYQDQLGRILRWQDRRGQQGQQALLARQEPLRLFQDLREQLVQQVRKVIKEPKA